MSEMRKISGMLAVMFLLISACWISTVSVIAMNLTPSRVHSDENNSDVAGNVNGGSGINVMLSDGPVAVSVIGSCPSSLHMLPQCECRDVNWRAYVVCRSAPVDLDRLRTTLKESGNATSLWLRVDGSNFPLLGQRAFGGLRLHSVQINASNVSHVADDAFVDMGHLRFLGLQDNRLAVVPVPALRRLVRLEMLSLAGNRITAVPPAAFVGLSGLRYLSLSQNAISTVERGSFGKGLRHVALSSNLLTSLNGSVRFLPHLEWLLLSNNRLTAVGDDDFDHLPSLTHLHLADNRLAFIRGGAFVRLPRLHVLNMGRNLLRRIDDTSFQGLHSLTDLDLSGNLIESIHPTAFKDLSGLLALDLADNQLVSLDGSIMSTMIQETGNDDESNTVIHGGFIGPLMALRRLNLSGNALETIDGSNFAHLSSLRELDISRNKILEIGSISQLSLPALQSLWLEDNLVSLVSSNTFIGLPSLHELDVRNNALTRLARDTFAHNPDLRVLKIQGNPWACDNHLVRVLLQLEANLTQIDDKPWCMNAVVQLEGP